MKKFYRTPEFYISFTGLTVLCTAFVLWCRNNAPSTPGLLAALCSAGLFAAVCLRFVPVWMASWRPHAAAAPLAEDDPPHILPKIFLCLLALNTLILLLVWALRTLSGHSGSFTDHLEFWRCTDSRHYLDIARDWYLSQGDWDRLVQLVFLPGYPILVRLMTYLVGNELYAGLLVSALCFAASGCVLYRLFRLDMPHADALRALRYLCLLPGVFFFTAPMSEGLFLLLCAACLYLARKGKWIGGCLCGALAAFTRSLGLSLVVPLFFELVSSWTSSSMSSWGQAGAKARLAQRFFALFLIPAGFGLYCLINYRVSGDPFQFMEYQSLHWSQHLGWFFNTAAYQTDLAISTCGEDPTNFLGLWLPNLLCSFAALVFLLLAVKALRPSYTAWALVYYLIAIGATWLLSAPRYLLVLIPLPMALSYLTKDRRADLAATACCLFFSGLYLYAFALRWQVW